MSAPVFPHPVLSGTGLTKRELFAAMAMQGMIAAGAPININGQNLNYEVAAVVIADALIKQLEKAK